jgi:CheY-like chemotaxis protein
LIADCHMPEMDGYELTTRIRAEESKTGARLPIIALTGDALAGAAQYCFDVGMDDYLSKPVSIDLLDATVQRGLPIAAALRRPAATLSPLPATVTTGDAVPDGLPAESDAAMVVDPSRLTEAFGGFTEDAIALLDQFFASAQSDIEQLRDALARKDTETARRTAHHAGGGAKGIGAVAFASLCVSIEQSLAGDGAVGVEDLAAQMVPALECARQQFATFRLPVGEGAEA